MTRPHRKWTYDSMAEFGQAAEANANGRYSHREMDDWTGCSFDESVRMAKVGWAEKLPDALAIAESAVATASQEHLMETFQPVWDVSGAEVDVARYLSGEPENMIDFPPSETSKVGRVVTLVSSCTFSAGFSAEQIIRRGELITALALALNTLGHAVEMWISCNVGGCNGGEIEVLVKVKGANDVLDPGMAIFAFAHPSILRCLMFGLSEGFTGKFKDGAIGSVLNVRPESFPEGSIIIPDALCGREDDPKGFLEKYLGELGLLAE